MFTSCMENEAKFVRFCKNGILGFNLSVVVRD